MKYYSNIFLINKEFHLQSLFSDGICNTIDGESYIFHHSQLLLTNVSNSNINYFYEIFDSRYYSSDIIDFFNSTEFKDEDSLDKQVLLINKPIDKKLIIDIKEKSIILNITDNKYDELKEWVYDNFTSIEEKRINKINNIEKVLNKTIVY